MKIISLRFANLNSLPGPYLIRFDAAPLADTGLFAITGPTGAGKSTLLDAIAVGLYGRVPRHDRQVGEMVSRHAPFAWSEVEFEVHETNADTGQTSRVRYRSRWEVKRKTRGEDKGGLGQDAMSLVRSPLWEAVVSGKEAVPAKVGELSGLDFGQFEQAVLLSQGKFARFLHAPEKERSALLEKMTNVGIYSRLSVAAFEKAKEETRKTELLAARLDATRLLSEEERADLGAQLDALNEAAEQHHEEAQDLNLCLTWRTLLDQLDRQLHDTAREVEALRQADEALQPEFARLADHQRANAKELATPMALAEVAHQALQRDTAQLHQLEQALPSLTAATSDTETTLTAAATAHQAAQTEENRLRPLLEEARTQDTALATTRQQLLKNQAAHDQNQRAHQQAEAAWHHQGQELQRLADQQTTLDTWLIDHSHEAELKDQLRELSREIIDLQEAQKELATREAHRSELLKSQQTILADLGRQQRVEAEALARQQAIVAEGQPCRTERDALLHGTSPAEVAQRADDLTAHLQGLQQLLPKAEAAHEQQVRAEALAAQLAQEAPALATAETAVKHLEAQQQAGQLLLESLRRELRLQQALADLNTHRQHLRPGEACPLCGATEHTLGADFSADANEQEQRVAAQQQALAQLDAALRTQTQDLTRRQTEQQQRQRQREEAAAAAEAAHHQAQQLAATLTPVPPHPADLGAVRELLAAATAAQATAVANRRQLATLDEKLAALRETYLAAGTAATTAQGELRLIGQRQEATELEISKLGAELAHWREQAAIYQDTIRDILRPHQLALPTRPPYDGLLATLEDRAAQYEARRAALAAGREKLLERNTQHKTQGEQLTQTTLQLAAAAETLAAEQLAFEQQQAARLAYYAGADPAAEAERLRRHTQQLAEAERLTRQQHAQQQQQLAIKQNALAVLQTQVAGHRTALAERQAELAAALGAAGFASAAEAQALLLPAAEAERLHQRRQQHLTATAAAARRLADLTAEQQQHAEFALTPLGAADLTAQLSALSAADDILQQRLGAVSNQLAQDDAARERLAEGRRELQLRQQEEQRWQDLADQIGSAKGDKFSQFAQGLTLSHLARLANLRLKQLTNRYSIEKTPNRNLELQIIDHDQADTKRPMASLSGGESFLVSLALALGLSELAGYKARIESLFIDEGFGTLDPESLNTALDALERLQHSGKMIGVISHVADLKERIGTQIRVQPVAGGNSTVRVVDVIGTETECCE
ncbi:AAA family ATPase [Hymenobacter sp. BT559]|uniref:SbcC/MukB-like Walker B domain-containing protein n=1 Tax=Hymenobacter sp. BT559 TaxID=2795729 RepID=UPI0018EB478D|nr:AAA family ATPase [Hymenobacter sp. BT559]MBJ6142022.1 AAA family ATPase [Hymenobacter sp. BT559]